MEDVAALTTLFPLQMSTSIHYKLCLIMNKILLSGGRHHNKFRAAQPNFVTQLNGTLTLDPLPFSA